MIEFHCQNYLNNFTNLKVNLTYDSNRNKSILIVDERPSLALIQVIKNALYFFRDHNLLVGGNERVFNLIKKFIGNDFFKIKIESYRLNAIQYNNLLTDFKFWSSIKEEKILIFQSDCLIFRSIDFDNFNHGMIGPVCQFFNEKEFIMNGGFSLRNRNLMLDLCKYKKDFDQNIVEDIFFTKLIRQHYPKLLPKMSECNDFAIESFGNPEKAVGLHGTDKYYCKEQLIIDAIKKSEINFKNKKIDTK